MIFETQAKADNFILFNKDEILLESGKAPVRSYYCKFCGGFHVTSNPSEESGLRLDNIDNQRIEDAIRRRNARKQIWAYHRRSMQVIKRASQLIKTGRITKTESELRDYLEIELFQNVREGMTLIQKDEISRRVEVLFQQIREIRLDREPEIDRMYELFDELEDDIIYKRIEGDTKLKLLHQLYKDIKPIFEYCRMTSLRSIMENKEKRFKKAMKTPKQDIMCIETVLYRETMLELINKIEIAHIAFTNGNINESNNQLSYVSEKLALLPVNEDSNIVISQYKMLRKCIDRQL